jgi:hypothetical protein
MIVDLEDILPWTPAEWDDAEAEPAPASVRVDADEEDAER